MILPLLAAVALLLVTPRFEEFRWLGLAIGVFAFALFRTPQLRLPRAFTYIGLVSYSLYLLHDNLGMIAIRGMAPLIPDITIRLLITFTGMVALSGLSFWAIELPWQKPLARRIEPVLDRLIGWVPILSPRSPRDRGKGSAGEDEARPRSW